MTATINGRIFRGVLFPPVSSFVNVDLLIKLYVQSFLLCLMDYFA